MKEFDVYIRSIGGIFMKKGRILILCCTLVLLNGYLLVSCASYPFQAEYNDEFVHGELEIEQDYYVTLLVNNNTESTIRIIPENCYYSHSGHSAVLFPYGVQSLVQGAAKFPPINIPPHSFYRGVFVDSSEIINDKAFYNTGIVDYANVRDWTPRDSNEIINAYFYFEYEIKGVTKQLIFEGNKFIKKRK